MSVRTTLLTATTLSIAAFAISPASAQTLRYANQGDLKSLDPYTLRETTTIAHHGHVYEGLVARDKDLKIIPGLAESWETPEPTRWRFHLRKNVKFHNGDPFTADDVIFSADRVRAKGSNFTTLRSDRRQIRQGGRLYGRRHAELAEPHSHLAMGHLVHHGQEVGEENNAVAPTPASATTPSYASLHANGTGAFIDREPSARRQDGVQGEPELVAQARAQPQGDRLHADRLGCDAGRRPALWRSGRHRTRSDSGHFARGFRARTLRC